MPTDTPPTDAISKWKRLQRTLARRATDVLAISIVLVGVLSVSGRLSEWWNTDSATVLDVSQSASEVVGSQTTWGQNAQPVLMQLGSLQVSMQRVVISGDETRAVQTLMDFCSDTLRRTQSALGKSPNQAAESRLIRGINSLTPAIEIDNRGSVYRIDTDNSQFVGLLFVAVTHATKDSVRAITGWGIALPRGTDDWSIFLFDKTRPAATTTSELPTPHDVTPVLSLSDQSSGQLSVFEQIVQDPARRIAQWRDFYDQAFSERGWRTTRSWAEQEPGWSARFEKRTENQIEGVELVLRVSDRQRAFGVASSHVENIKPK